MDRIETYVGQSILEWCFSKPDQNKMVALSKLTAATLGTGIIANGLACTATGPASMFVNIGAGELYQSANLENTACGTLPQDLTHQIMKQGILLDTLQVPNSSTGVTAFAAPGSSGQSINYLIEATYSDSDVSIDPTTGATNVVLPFYNSSNPQTPYNGPGNTGASSNTFRKGVITFTVKAGAAATTGTQTTPTVDSGYVGLWVVTVPFGASTLTSANIAQYAGAPILPSSLLASIQSSNLTYGVDSGSANTVQAKFPIPVATLTDGLDVWVKIAAANTGATTFTPNPGVISASPVIGAAHAALQGGELVVGGRANLIWRQDVSSWVLVECTGAAIQVAPATASQHAVQFGQVSGVVGQARNLLMNVAAASATATLTADEIIVETALGGLRYCLPSFSKTINLATTGAGGMDTGTAPVSGFVAIYAIWNPTTATSALLATNCTSIVAPNVYGAGNMPAGYTASALVSVIATTAGSVFSQCTQRDRDITVVNKTIISTSSGNSTPTSFVTTSFPKNAVRVKGYSSFTSASAATVNAGVYADVAGSDASIVGLTSAAGGFGIAGSFDVLISAPQTIYYTLTSTAGAPSWAANLERYSI